VTKNIFFFLACLLFLTPTAFAEARHVRDVFGSLGATGYQTGGIFGGGRNGSGFSAGGGIGVRMWRGIGAEFELNTVNATLAANQRAMWTTYTGNAVFRLRIAKTEPYLLIGAGGTNRSGRNAAAVAFGAGIKISLPSHLYLRPDVRIAATDLGFFDGFIRGSVGIGYRW
jgi:hypothetical protein